MLGSEASGPVGAIGYIKKPGPVPRSWEEKLNRKVVPWRVQLVANAPRTRNTSRVE